MSEHLHLQNNNHSQDNRRIARNTLMLYIRMFLILLVTLFSFRILLKELGEAGYGIYNVVAGVVVLFSFLSSALTQSTQRFLSYHIGRNEYQELKRVFSTCVNVHIVIGIVVILLSESVGLWFLNTYMQFPSDAKETANIVYQCSIVTFVIQILTAPYQAAIISHERMSFYAYFSIIEVILKFSAALLLSFITGNKVAVYAAVLVMVSACIWFSYRMYCRHNFSHCTYAFVYDSGLFKKIISFSGWNMLGGIGNVGATQGVNIILNIFRGVGLNAAMGVANQVSGAVSSFVTNLQTAFNPQIIKSYAANDADYFNSLIFRASRFSFSLIFVLGFPIILCCTTVFDIWLTETPEYAVPFTQLIIIFCMIDAISGPLWTAAQASGRIKTYMLIIATMIFTNVPAAYMILWLKLSPVWVMVYKVVMNLVIHFTRIVYLRWLIRFPSMHYLRRVMLPVCLYVLVAVPIPLWLARYTHTHIQNILLMLLTVAESALLALYVMMNKAERSFILSKVRNILIHRDNRER